MALSAHNAERIYRKLFDEMKKADIAERLNVAPNTVSNWRQRGVSLNKIYAVSQMTGKSLPEIRPDVYR